MYMKKSLKPIVTIDEYIHSYPKDMQIMLKKMRSIIQKTSPKATELISYSMPAYKLNGKYLAYFAAFKKHIGFYPFPSGIEAFKKETEDFVTSKGGIQFPYDKPLPVALIRKILKYRIKENMNSDYLKKTRR